MPYHAAMKVDNHLASLMEQLSIRGGVKLLQWEILP